MLNIKVFVFNGLGVNTFVLYNEKGQSVIVDAGNSNKEEDELIFKFIDDNHLTPLMLLSTHLHIDHVMGNYSLSKRYGIPLAAYPVDKEYIVGVWKYAGVFGLDYDENACVFPEIELKDDEIIGIGEDKIRVIYTPGHALGHVCFYDEADGFILTGDTLFYRGVGRYDFPGGSYKELKNSLRNRLYQLPDDIVCYPGHGRSTTIGDEKLYNNVISMY